MPTSTLKAKKGALESQLWESGRSFIGVDEVGRGCLAGPVVAACVSLDRDALERLSPKQKSLIRDSKTLSAKQRDEALEIVRTVSWECAVGLATVGEIEEHGIVGANFLAMKRALSLCNEGYNSLLVDGRDLIPNLVTPKNQIAIIKGDSLCFSIAAASILAKVTRDAYMGKLDSLHPGYDFAQNVGYGTKTHLNAITELGPCRAHRRNFQPVAGILAKSRISALSANTLQPNI